MKQKDFDRLVTSIKQAGAIRRGRLKPGRVTEFQADDVRAIRLRLDKWQAEFAIRCERCDAAELGTGSPTS